MKAALRVLSSRTGFPGGVRLFEVASVLLRLSIRGGETLAFGDVEDDVFGDLRVGRLLERQSSGSNNGRRCAQSMGDGSPLGAHWAPTKVGFLTTPKALTRYYTPTNGESYACWSRRYAHQVKRWPEIGHTVQGHLFLIGRLASRAQVSGYLQGHRSHEAALRARDLKGKALDAREAAEERWDR
ncbi:hypothetical protein M408DRAFT_311279 [Serendipita vermifera MAFF 305830]|uniref:Uncharacterized protein n=1 Tax=Serendipita vermifera MAFF 305830 TaxID=933852 RepID=A0A0C2XE61_SERVB|nr:hypothetical protein M408DRAFT_311279 [Serendipita vermifera MAFF 305830]